MQAHTGITGLATPLMKAIDQTRSLLSCCCVGYACVLHLCPLRPHRQWCYPVLQRLLFVGRGLVAAHAMNTRYTPPAAELVEGLCGPCLAIIVDAVSHRVRVM